MKSLTLYMLLFMSLRHFTDSKMLMSVVLQKCTSYCNPEYCKIKTVCRPLNRTSKFVSMDIYLNPGIKLEAPVYVGNGNAQPITNFTEPKFLVPFSVIMLLQLRYSPKRRVPGVFVDLHYLSLEAITYKKFATVYRPHMLKLKSEICEVLALRTHPLFKLIRDESSLQNILQPCPFTGHRYTKARITNLNDYDVPQVRLVPAGEWSLVSTISIKRNGSEVVVVTWADYYEVKPLTAEEF